MKGFDFRAKIAFSGDLAEFLNAMDAITLEYEELRSLIEDSFYENGKTQITINGKDGSKWLIKYSTDSCFNVYHKWCY